MFMASYLIPWLHQPIFYASVLRVVLDNLTNDLPGLKYDLRLIPVYQHNSDLYCNQEVILEFIGNQTQQRLY